jgi:large subunit ribosomal protein L27
LGMVAVEMEEEEAAAGEGREEKKKEDMVFETRDGRTLRMRRGYYFSEGNWEIGRAAEKAGVKLREFKKEDRWLAWRKRNARKEKSVARGALIKSAKEQKAKAKAKAKKK